MDALVTLKASPQEFDTIRAALTFYMTRKQDDANERDSGTPEERRTMRAESLKAHDLLERMGG